MSRQDIERLRSALESFNRTGEVDVEYLASDFELQQASSIVDTAGVFRGRDALREALAELEGSFEEIRMEAEDFIEAPNRDIVAIVRVRGRGRGSGMEIDNRIAHVWTFRDGEAIRLVVYEEPAEAFAAAGVKKG